MVSKVTEEFDEKMRNIPNYEANVHIKQSEEQRSGPSKSASDTSQSHFEHPMSLDEVPMIALNCWRNISCAIALFSPWRIVCGVLTASLQWLQFRSRAHEAVDFICDYYSRVDSLPVRSSVEVCPKALC